MNQLDAYVTRVLAEPYENYGRWWVPVEYDCWGVISEGAVMCHSEEEARMVKKGYSFSV